MDGVKSYAEFEVIDIVDESSPYPVRLVLEWALYCNGIINLKKRQMSFEDGANRIIVPIDPVEGPRFIKTVRDERELYTIYNITSNVGDYVETGAKGNLNWDNSSSWENDSEQALEE